MVDLAGGIFVGYSAGAEPIQNQSPLVREALRADRIHLYEKTRYQIHHQANILRWTRCPQEIDLSGLRAPFVAALMALRGFQIVAAMTVISELGDLSRFETPRQLMSYLGLVPGEDSSGPRRRQGSITKCGNGHARWMLVDCFAA